MTGTTASFVGASRDELLLLGAKIAKQLEYWSSRDLNAWIKMIQTEKHEIRPSGSFAVCVNTDYSKRGSDEQQLVVSNRNGRGQIMYRIEIARAIHNVRFPDKAIKRPSIECTIPPDWRYVRVRFDPNMKKGEGEARKSIERLYDTLVREASGTGSEALDDTSRKALHAGTLEETRTVGIFDVYFGPDRLDVHNTVYQSEDEETSRAC